MLADLMKNNKVSYRGVNRSSARALKWEFRVLRPKRLRMCAAISQGESKQRARAGMEVPCSAPRAPRVRKLDTPGGGMSI